MFKTTRRRLAHREWRPEPTAVLLALWGLFIIYGTMLPFDFSASGELVQERLRRLAEHPWHFGSWTDLISNVLLFIPWGFLLATWLADRGTHFIAALILALISGALFSVSVELAQLFAPSRTTSVMDLLTNTSGSMLGALIGWPWALRVWPRLSIRIRQLVASRPLAGCALAAALCLVFAGLAPFDVSLDVGDLKAAVKKARLIPFGPPMRGAKPPAKPWSWAGELLSWTLVGGLGAVAARESGWRGAQALGGVVAVSGALSLAIETVQVVIPSREIDMTSVVLSLLGAAFGASVVGRSGSGPARVWITPALVIWGVVVVLSALTPPQFAWPHPPFVRPERFVPFWSYYARTSVADLADLLGQVLAFVPLGALLAARSSWRSIAGAAAIGLGCGFVLEFGQIFLPDRTAELTDVLSAAAGAGLGAALWRWGESLRSSSQGAARYRVGAQAGRRA
jgi:glycopeptide antibiotics resistance protein